MDIKKLQLSAAEVLKYEEEKDKKRIGSETKTLNKPPRNLDSAMTDNFYRQKRKDNPVIAIQECIELHVRQFESELNSEQEVMIMAASFGSQVIFYVDSIEFSTPNMIIFHGFTESGKPTRLIQHCNQLNFLLQAADKHDPDKDRKPIGFITS